MISPTIETFVKDSTDEIHFAMDATFKVVPSTGQIGQLFVIHLIKNQTVSELYCLLIII